MNRIFLSVILVFASVFPELGARPSNFTLWQLPSQINTIGNSYIIRMNNGKIVVMDGGVKEEEAYLRGFLAALGNEVEIWFVSHPHPDHIGALNEIVKNQEGIKIGKICHSEFSPESPFVIKRKRTYYLVYTNYRHGIVYLTSKNPVNGWQEMPEDKISIMNGVSATDFIDTVPSVGLQYCGISWESPFLLLQYRLFQYYGGTEIVREIYELDLKWMEKASRLYPGLIVDKDLGDHESIVPVQVTGTSYYLQAVSVMKKFAALMGDQPNEERLGENKLK